MPGCVLHVDGIDFDAALFLADATLRPYDVFRRGDAVAIRGPRAGRLRESSGFKCLVSEVYGDLRGQIADAIQFLSSHRADFERLAALDTVQNCQLDFGYNCRLGDGIAVQGEYLPVDFLELVGQLRVAVALSLYPPPART